MPAGNASWLGHTHARKSCQILANFLQRLDHQQTAASTSDAPLRPSTQRLFTELWHSMQADIQRRVVLYNCSNAA
jgi:hypothetical protein